MEIHHDISFSDTLPADFYNNPKWFDKLKDAVFARFWQFVGDESDLLQTGSSIPLTLLEGYLDEPLVLTRDEQGLIHCMSNVCTHRGNIVVRNAGVNKMLVCAYHGRKFHLDGRFGFMPEFKDAQNFPTACDDLHRLPLYNWKGMLFSSIQPQVSFEEMIQPILDRLYWLPMEQFKFEARYSQDYLIRANWALYCDNYLEGFHIPYVHPGLNQVVDYGTYTTEVYPWCNLQLGLAKGADEIFDIPEGAPDRGKRVAAYYYWVFPNMMFNFYPWGCSVNIVRPVSQHITKVSFRTYIWKPEKFDASAAHMLEKVEREDEDIVEQVQKGVKSRLYKKGRFSPKREMGVHHFHRLLSEILLSV
ncbi:MAG: aromatic ring-hydroxylating oxygenase subunit alpha [Flavobacteriales bacterium]